MMFSFCGLFGSKKIMAGAVIGFFETIFKTDPLTMTEMQRNFPDSVAILSFTEALYTVQAPSLFFSFAKQKECF